MSITKCSKLNGIERQKCYEKEEPPLSGIPEGSLQTSKLQEALKNFFSRQQWEMRATQAIAFGGTLFVAGLGLYGRNLLNRRLYGIQGQINGLENRVNVLETQADDTDNILDIYKKIQKGNIGTAIKKVGKLVREGHPGAGEMLDWLTNNNLQKSQKVQTLCDQIPLPLPQRA